MVFETCLGGNRLTVQEARLKKSVLGKKVIRTGLGDSEPSRKNGFTGSDCRRNGRIRAAEMGAPLTSSLPVVSQAACKLDVCSCEDSSILARYLSLGRSRCLVLPGFRGYRVLQLLKLLGLYQVHRQAVVSSRRRSLKTSRF